MSAKLKAPSIAASTSHYTGILKRAIKVSQALTIKRIYEDFCIGSPLPRGKVVFAPTTPSAAHTNEITKDNHPQDLSKNFNICHSVTRLNR